MKVNEVMTKDVQSCTPETNLADAAMRMWDGDCGTLPVVDTDGKVIGMITDRDICIAAATKHQDIAGIKVGEVITGQVQSCTPETSVRDALKTFEQARVRRLPVVDDDGELQGILSMNDIVLHTGEERVINLHHDAVRVLLNHGADVNARANDGATALMLAASVGDAEIVKALLNQGADIKGKYVETGQIALMLAAERGYTNIAQLLGGD